MKLGQAATLCILDLFIVSTLWAENTGFRRDGSGRYPEATPPTAWSTESNVVWKTALTNWSNGSPILVGDRLFMCAEPATMICVSASDGKILWSEALPDLPSPAPKTHGVNGYTSFTPCSDGKNVWAVFGQGVVACWSVAGKRAWLKKLETPPHEWGGCVSPRLAGGVLVVQFDNMFGLDLLTGAEKWKLKTPWGWGTPAVVKVGGKDALYTCKGAVVDAATGKELTKGLIGLDFNSPTIADGELFYLQQKPQAYAVPTKADELPRALWPNAGIAGDRYYATPVVGEGLVFAINQGANLSVLDRKTGALVYEKKMDFLKGTIYPSPILADKYIYVSSEQGQTVVLKTGRQYEEVARNTLEAFRACPVFSGSRMYIRGNKYLWCIGK